ncbi:MAG: hypothetical protein WAV60_19990, partial [Anaerolineae bacterium]
MFGSLRRLFCPPQGENPVHPVNPVQINWRSTECPTPRAVKILFILSILSKLMRKVNSDRQLMIR